MARPVQRPPGQPMQPSPGREAILGFQAAPDLAAPRKEGSSGSQSSTPGSYQLQTNGSAHLSPHSSTPQSALAARLRESPSPTRDVGPASNFDTKSAPAMQNTATNQRPQMTVRPALRQVGSHGLGWRGVLPELISLSSSVHQPFVHLRDQISKFQ